jgi:hypothetical protein
MEINRKKLLTLISTSSICFFIRLIPLRMPNFEPIMAFQMPLSNAFGFIFGFFFGFLNILFFDFATSNVSTATLICATTYGLLGIASTYFFRKNVTINYWKLSIFGTVIYDMVTCLTGPLLFNQHILQALIGQIPFSLIHLTTNLFLGLFVSPMIEKLIRNEEELVTIQ